MIERFVYVARLQTGDEIALRGVLEQLPTDALGDHNIQEFATYVGSGYCVLQFGLAEGDFQVQFERFMNDPRMERFRLDLAKHLIEGQQIARPFAPGHTDAHPDASRQADRAGSVTSAQLPLAAEASHWTRS